MNAAPEAELSERIRRSGGKLLISASELLAQFDLDDDEDSAYIVTRCLARQRILVSPPLYETDELSEVTLTRSRGALFVGRQELYMLSWKRFVLFAALGIAFLLCLALVSGAL